MCILNLQKGQLWCFPFLGYQKNGLHGMSKEDYEGKILSQWSSNLLIPIELPNTRNVTHFENSIITYVIVELKILERDCPLTQDNLPLCSKSKLGCVDSQRQNSL